MVSGVLWTDKQAKMQSAYCQNAVGESKTIQLLSRWLFHSALWIIPFDLFTANVAFCPRILKQRLATSYFSDLFVFQISERLLIIFSASEITVKMTKPLLSTSSHFQPFAVLLFLPFQPFWSFE